MGRIFVGHGGGGSAAMIQRLRASGALCHCRPDVALLPADTPRLGTSARDGMQVLSAAGYRDRPAPASADLFAKRSGGYRFDPAHSIHDNLAAYLCTVAAGEAHVWLCRAPCFGFLTSAGVTGAVCLVRHPLHQYLSFTQPYRHADWAEAFGGRASEGAIRYFAAAWCAFTADCLGCAGRIIRYEHARADAADDPFLSWLVQPLDSSKLLQRRMLPSHATQVGARAQNRRAGKGRQHTCSAQYSPILQGGALAQQGTTRASHQRRLITNFEPDYSSTISIPSTCPLSTTGACTSVANAPSPG
ncbi:MAG TPA: hypothetical protein VFF69_08765 [Phycisphaerales bacterium]|nr:hypothetical protein [Phycisphaerales bacterium]